MSTPTPQRQIPNGSPATDTFPLFKGATRVPTIAGGVPTRPFIGLVMVAAGLGMLSLYAWALIPVLYPVMAVIAREDDRAFRVVELWLRTKLANRHKHYWNGSTYAPVVYPRRPWSRTRGDRP